MLDAAEELFVTRGYQSSSMEVIARHAGYSRTAIYRQFPSRQRLLEALVQRTTQRHMSSILGRVPADAGPVDLLVESLVIVSTELPRDPLLATISDQTADGTLASLIANDPGLTGLVEATVAEMISADAQRFRPGLRPHDLGRFIIATAMSMLTGIVPGLDDPGVARRYVETFILPAFVARPPDPSSVFRGSDDPR